MCECCICLGGLARSPLVMLLEVLLALFVWIGFVVVWPGLAIACLRDSKGVRIGNSVLAVHWA